MEIISRFDKFANKVNLVVETIIGINMIILTIVVFAQVFYRYILRDPIPWSAEIARYLFISIVFFGLSSAYRKGEHIGFTVILNHVSPITSAIILLLIDFSALFLMGILIFYGHEAVQLAGRQISPGIKIPMSIPYSLVPIGATLVVVQIVSIILNKAKYIISLPGSR